MSVLSWASSLESILCSPPLHLDPLSGCWWLISLRSVLPESARRQGAWFLSDGFLSGSSNYPHQEQSPVNSVHCWNWRNLRGHPPGLHIESPEEKAPERQRLSPAQAPLPPSSVPWTLVGCRSFLSHQTGIMMFTVKMRRCPWGGRLFTVKWHKLQTRGNVNFCPSSLSCPNNEFMLNLGSYGWKHSSSNKHSSPWFMTYMNPFVMYCFIPSWQVELVSVIHILYKSQCGVWRG